METPLVGIIMGSASDLEVMQPASEVLKTLGIPHELDIVSAHRTPEKLMAYAKGAVERGLKVIIAGAGGAAHLPGMIASATPLPVIGVPVKSHNSIIGIDSLLSIVQMPNGIPVATVAINAALNAGLLAAKILATSNPKLLTQLETYQAELANKVHQSANEVAFRWWPELDK